MAVKNSKTGLPNLDPRLELAASMVEGSVCADVGCDHGYVAISLVLSGKCRKILASDIRPEPLNSARCNAARFGASDNIEFFLANGLSGIPVESCGVSDIVICGMGGELIASILDSSAYVKTGINLVLQPMTRPEKLRQYLSHGFTVEDEKLCRCAGHIYCCIKAKYTGVVSEYTAAELLLGRENIKKHSALLSALISQEIARTEKIIRGRTEGGLDCQQERRLIEELRCLNEREMSKV